MINEQIFKTIQELESEGLTLSRESKDMCKWYLIDMMLEFSNDDYVPVKLSQVLIDFCYFLISVLDPEVEELPDLIRSRTEDG